MSGTKKRGRALSRFMGKAEAHGFALDNKKHD
jgi:hypothetical protein